MKKRYLFPLINISAVIGCVLAVFTVPPETSIKVFSFVCLGVIIVLNILVFLKVRARQKPGYVAKPPDKLATIVVWVVCLAFFAEVIRGFLKYLRMP